MIRVGLTGNVASGKSTVARVWEAAGVPMVSADELAREAVVPGSRGLQEIVQAFGPGVLDPRGALDRARMRGIAFASPEARRRLESILHPRIAELRNAWVEARRREGAEIVGSEVPLLFEAGLEGDFDRIVLVEAPRELRLQRLVEGRGLDPEEAERIMAAQSESDRRRAAADDVLCNDGTPEELEEEARRLLERIRGTDAPPRDSTEGP
jgi:dephospho-CoA kinase